MPYCPKCDMEFITGNTICSSCKGPLLDSKEAADSQAAPAETRLYIRKAQQYEDLKSSASAFYLVGAVLLIASILNVTGILRLSAAGSAGIIPKLSLILMGTFSFIAAIISSRSAKSVETQADEEEHATKELVRWFFGHHSAETIDSQLIEEGGFEELSPEEQSLKRFELIQDIFLINFDIQEQGYVDLLAEEIYSGLYET